AVTTVFAGRDHERIDAGYRCQGGGGTRHPSGGWHGETNRLRLDDAVAGREVEDVWERCDVDDVAGDHVDSPATMHAAHPARMLYIQCSAGAESGVDRSILRNRAAA